MSSQLPGIDQPANIEKRVIAITLRVLLAVLLAAFCYWVYLLWTERDPAQKEQDTAFCHGLLAPAHTGQDTVQQLKTLISPDECYRVIGREIAARAKH